MLCTVSLQLKSAHPSQQCTPCPTGNPARYAPTKVLVHVAGSLWLAANPSKRWTEVFFLAYSPFWITWALCILVPFKLYDVSFSTSQCAALATSERSAATAVVVGFTFLYWVEPQPTCTALVDDSSLQASNPAILQKTSVHCWCIWLFMQHLDEWGYLLVGLAAALPCFAVPLLLPNKVCSTPRSLLGTLFF